MAEATVKVGAQIDVVDNTGQGTKSAIDNLNQFGDKANTVNGLLTKLGATAAAYFSFTAVVGFLKEGTNAFTAETEAINLMNAKLEKAGLQSDSTQASIKGLVEEMESLGVEGDNIVGAFGKLASKSKDAEQGLKLTRLAANLAASGYGSVEENADNLAKILEGRGQRALLQYGIVMEGNHSIADQLANVQAKVTRSVEEYADTTEGRITQAQNNWENFGKSMGKVGAYFRDELIKDFNSFYDSNKSSIEELTILTAYFIEATKKSASSGWDTLGIGLQTLLLGAKTAINEVTSPINGDKANKRLREDNAKWWAAIQESAEKTKNNTLLTYEDFKAQFQSFGSSIVSPVGEGGSNPFPDLGNAAEEAANSAEEAAKKMSDSFTSFSNKVLSEVDKQKDAIAGLRESMMSETEKYNKELERIEEDKSLMGVENSAAKEVALANAKNNWENKMSGLQSQESDKTKSLISLNSQLGNSDLLGKISKEQGSFLWNIGQSPVQQQYTFNFNGDVNDVEKLKQLIISTLDRQAALQKVK